jgi:hypothetical protein
MSDQHRLQPQASVRERVFALFRAFGTSTIFGNPGSTELPMFRDFPADFRYVLALQELVAVGMADGCAQATRNADLVNLHFVTGLGHALGAVFTAYKNQTPLVIITGQQPRSILPFEPFLYAERADISPMIRSFGRRCVLRRTSRRQHTSTSVRIRRDFAAGGGREEGPESTPMPIPGVGIKRQILSISVGYFATVRVTSLRRPRRA